MTDDRLIFLISQPRAGSTMLQSILNGHPRIDTAPEPWLMFTPLYALKPGSLTTDFGHRSWRQATDDFLQRLPGGHEAYDQGIRRMALDLYGRATEEGHRFLDKTPRYFLIFDDLVRLFPEAKFIVLFRNPLAVLMSMLASFPYPEKVCVTHASDLLDGPHLCAKACREHADRIHRLSYEDLVTYPELETRRLCERLGLDFDPIMTEYGNHRLPEGCMGDPNVHRHRRPTTDSLEKWKRMLTSRERAALCLSYLEALGDELVAEMGYDAPALRNEVQTAMNGLGSEYRLRDRVERARVGVNEIWQKVRSRHRRYHAKWAA